MSEHPPYRCGAWCSHDDEIEAARAARVDPLHGPAGEGPITVPAPSEISGVDWDSRRFVRITETVKQAQADGTEESDVVFLYRLLQKATAPFPPLAALGNQPRGQSGAPQSPASIVVPEDLRALVEALSNEPPYPRHHHWCQGFDACRAQVLRLLESARAARAPQPPALLTYVTTEKGPVRDAAFLRTYAKRVRNRTAAAWEIPNSVAQTLEDIAARLEASATTPKA